MGHCDICNAVGSWDTVSARNFQKAIYNGFNPVSLKMFDSGIYTPETWKMFAQSPMAAGTDWALCTKCMPKITPYLNEKVVAEENNKKEGCFIATACYGDYNAKEVLILKEFRDKVLLKSNLGKLFVSFYYTVSPPIAYFISKNHILRIIIKSCLINPVSKIVSKK